MEGASKSVNESLTLAQPTNQELMLCLKTIEMRLDHMDRRLGALEEVKTKCVTFDMEIKKLWGALTNRNKRTREMDVRKDENVDSTTLALSLINDKVVNLEKERDSLKKEVVHLRSQSMRNNLVFTNIPEVDTERSEDTEATLKEFLVENMNMTKESVDRMVMERVHRIGSYRTGRCRKVLANFLEFKDKERVRKQWKLLQGTPYYVHEQFPKEVHEQRSRLYPRVKAARDEGKIAWLSFDTLYIDGKAVRN